MRLYLCSVIAVVYRHIISLILLLFYFILASVIQDWEDVVVVGGWDVRPYKFLLNVALWYYVSLS